MYYECKDATALAALLASINLLIIYAGQLAEGDLLLKANGIDLQGISSDK